MVVITAQAFISAGSFTSSTTYSCFFLLEVVAEAEAPKLTEV